MSVELAKIQSAIAPLREQVINHKVYGVIKEVEDLQIFMQYHIYAVWDFMSLLKSLQNNLTCTTVPWFPKGNATTRYLINEIVAGEESDVDGFGVRKSHFELYLDAMVQCGAITAPFNAFIVSLKETGSLNEAFHVANTPAEARDFVDFTFNAIAANHNHIIASIFTFGREDLIPGMFISMVNQIYKDLPDRISIFKYYLERHIEVDGGHHSHLALEMTAELCGTNEQYWEEATKYTMLSLQKRIDLWDGAYAEIMKRKAG